MQNFCIAYREILSKHELYATGTTGRLIVEVTNLNVHKYLAGHLGGGQQLAAQIEHNQMDLVIFSARSAESQAARAGREQRGEALRYVQHSAGDHLATAELLIKSWIAATWSGENYIIRLYN